MVGAHLREQGANTGGVGIVRLGVDHPPLADHVVHDDETAEMRELDGGAEVCGRVALVGVDEDEIERLAVLGLELRETVERRADADLHPAVQSGTRDVGSRHLGVVLIELEADETPIVGQGATHPDGAVSAEGADLEDAASMDRSCQQVQELSLRRGHRNVRERAALSDGRLEHGVRWLQQAGCVRVDGVPAIVTHGLAVYRGPCLETSVEPPRPPRRANASPSPG